MRFAMPQATASATFRLVRLEGFPEPLLARHFENGRSGTTRGSSLEVELARHDWDAAPCFVITRLRPDAPATSPSAPAPGPAAASTARRRSSAVDEELRSSWALRAALGFIGALQRARQRRALSLLDCRLLDDIGVSLEEAAAEARKPPWRL